MSDNPALTPRPETSIDAKPERNSGTAAIKPEYIIYQKPTVESASKADLNNLDSIDDDAEGSTSRAGRNDRDNRDGRDSKRRKVDKKDKKGQNKNRHFPVIRENTVKICRSWELTGECTRGGEGVCRFKHSWEGYFSIKPADIHFEHNAPLRDTAVEGGYVIYKDRTQGGEDELGRTIDLSTTCPVVTDLGYCPFGWRCRFLGGHVRKVEGDSDEQSIKSGKRIGGWEVIGSETTEWNEAASWKQNETNWPNQSILHSLRSSTYPFPYSTKYLHHIQPDKPLRLGPEGNSVKVVDEEEAMNVTETLPSNGVVDGESEAMDVPLRPEEKRRLNWDNGLYLAPLTTVGNLPFRRVCIDYGATITISEMALAQPLVTGHTDEWALIRRHKSEKMFGVQLAGGYPNRMVPAAEMIAKEIGSGVDFVDINLGCPIDLVFNQGAGSALLDNPGRLGKIIVGMNRALGEVPLTVKFRTGVATNKPNAHKLVPRFATEWGAGALTLHGRSRQQRYSKLADWAYIKQCADTLRVSLEEANLPRVPIFGNGDCFSAQGYWEEKEASGVDGIMVARGALIKPWIFTEIAEKREWDISATERLEGIRKFAEYGLSHWGSDTQGVNTTRRFLCEALSFQHRYIPIGLLERMPAQINERPPAFRGRTELETLLASPFAGDWVKISEMFLGKVDDSFNFIPKHKSNAYGGEEAQG